jgi:hypothetical protein
MVEMRLGSGRFFERGLESFEAAPERHGLPEFHELAPSWFVAAGTVDSLLAVENLESLLEASVLPEIAESWLLAPHRFRAVLAAVLQRFANTAALRRKANPAAAALLDGAVGVLEVEVALRELLQANLTALLQG